MSVALLKPIDIPSKYDVIPIHASDIASFQRCRRYWDWSSPARNNLRHKVTLYGVDLRLWFGSGIHYALEQYYNPLLQRDPVETFRTWYELQWHGGIISDLDLTYDPNPVLIEDDGIVFDHYAEDNGVRAFRYKTQGMQDLLPSPDEEEFQALLDLGLGMMTFYKEYAAKNDDFEVVAAESTFSVPLGFKAVDIREGSPNFGNELEVHLRGKRDMIVHYPDRHDPRYQYGIVDHKTAIKIDEDYFLKLENDPQCTTYIVASVWEAREYGFPWTEIRDVLYNALRKAYPRPPTFTTRGFPSIDRSKESTTAAMFKEAVIESGLADWYNDDEKAQGYYEYLLEEGDKVFVQRDHAYRNSHEIQAAYEELQMIAKEMLDPYVHIYKHPSGMSYCTRCQFRAPCLAKDDGSDWKELLVQGYELNKGR